MEFKQRDTSLWISARREATYNTPFTLNTDFLRVTSTNPVVLLPEMEKIDDALRTGNDSEFPTILHNQYWLPIPASLTDHANFDVAGRLALRAFGGAVADSADGTATKHKANLMSKADGLQQPSSTIISELGGASFLAPGCVVDRFRLSQEGSNPVQAQFDLIGSGKHRSPHNIASLPPAPTFTLPRSKPILEYTDSALRDLTANCRVRSWSYELALNHSPSDDRCPGDPTQIAGDYTVTEGATAASHIRKLTRGGRVVTAEIVILLDQPSPVPEWLQMAGNTVLTNVKFGAVGVLLDTLPTPDVFETLMVVIPNARFRAVRSVDSNGKAALTLSLQTMYDSLSVGSYCEVTNNIATNYD